MLRMTDPARLELGQSHRICSRVDVLHGGHLAAQLQVLGGEVEAQANRSVLRTCKLVLTDPTGELTETDAGDLLSPYDAEVKPYIGLILPSGVLEMVPWGLYRLTNHEVSQDDSGLTISLTGQDRALIYQTPLPGPVTVPAGTPVEEAISLLLSRVFGGFSWDPWLTGRTVGPLLYESDAQAWDSALTLAESVGGWLYHDRDGTPVLAPYAATNSPTFQRFEDTVISASRDEDADEIRNSVVMQSTTGLIRVVAEDEDPSSPTYVHGSFGRRQVTVTNPHLGSVAQAEEAAIARLVQELGRSQTVSWSCVPDPQTDVGDAVTVNAPAVGVEDLRVVVDSLSLSFDVGSAMRVTGRRSVVSQDGGLVPVLL